MSLTEVGKERSRQYYQDNREKLQQQAKDNQRYLRLQAIAAYGDKCCCCQESDIKFLTLDHQQDDGAEHRRGVIGAEKGKGDSRSFFRHLRETGYPRNLGLRVMCWNCNCGRAANGGICPHEEGWSEL